MGNAVSNFVQKAVEAVKNTVSDMFRSIAPPIVRYVVEHPIRTLGHVGSAALLVAPGIITAPLLAVAGFTGSGVAAGSLAAAVQSGLGTVSAGSTFAVLQSAAMGGYGAGTVAAVAGGTAVAAEAVGAAARAGGRK
ncbi:hypothetical protein ACJQWK_11340 [Exserohilum turcicum]